MGVDDPTGAYVGQTCYDYALWRHVNDVLTLPTHALSLAPCWSKATLRTFRFGVGVNVPTQTDYANVNLSPQQ